MSGMTRVSKLTLRSTDPPTAPLVFPSSQALEELCEAAVHLLRAAVGSAAGASDRHRLLEIPRLSRQPVAHQGLGLQGAALLATEAYEQAYAGPSSSLSVA